MDDALYCLLASSFRPVGASLERVCPVPDRAVYQNLLVVNPGVGLRHPGPGTLSLNREFVASYTRLARLAIAQTKIAEVLEVGIKNILDPRGPRSR